MSFFKRLKDKLLRKKTDVNTSVESQIDNNIESQNSDNIDSQIDTSIDLFANIQEDSQVDTHSRTDIEINVPMGEIETQSDITQDEVETQTEIQTETQNEIASDEELTEELNLSDINLQLDEKIIKEKISKEKEKTNIDKTEKKSLKEKLFRKKEKKSKLVDEISKKRKETSTLQNVKEESYKKGLKKSRDGFIVKIKNLLSRKVEVDEEYFEELEEILISADISADITMEISDSLKQKLKREKITDPKKTMESLIEIIYNLYVGSSKTTDAVELDITNDRLNVILVTGVNGSGKTTSIAKIANKLISNGKKVVLVAGDTFRAGAVEQLRIWCERVGATFVFGKTNADPASVIFDGINKAKEMDADVLICDTAGRLQNKKNLMIELEKIDKIIKREIPDAPHESLLVIDATTGQNGVSQAKHFSDVSNITGIILTKMDGTSKGGIILPIKRYLNIPVKFIGLGEKLEDLQEFSIDNYIDGLLNDLEEYQDV